VDEEGSLLVEREKEEVQCAASNGTIERSSDCYTVLDLLLVEGFTILEGGLPSHASALMP